MRHRTRRNSEFKHLGVRYMLMRKRAANKRKYKKPDGVKKLHNWMRNNYVGSHGLWLKRQHEIDPPDYEWRIDGRNHDYISNSLDRTYLLDKFTEIRLKDKNVV